MITGINDFKNVFFIGVAGTGMSAIAQYLSGIGKNVSGSDRFFNPDTYNETKEKWIQERMVNLPSTREALLSAIFVWKRVTSKHIAQLTFGSPRTRSMSKSALPS